MLGARKVAPLLVLAISLQTVAMTAAGHTILDRDTFLILQKHKRRNDPGKFTAVTHQAEGASISLDLIRSKADLKGVLAGVVEEVETGVPKTATGPRSATMSSASAAMEVSKSFDLQRS